MDLGSFVVNSVIVHDVPKPEPGRPTTGPLLSDVESELDAELRNFFSERIVRSLGKGFDVVFDEATTSPVPVIVNLALADPPADFVKASQAIAMHLFSSQSRVNSPGLLTVIDGEVDHQRCLAILKLEREQGLRAHQDRTAAGVTFTLEHLRELMLTEGTRVFKAALFQQFGDEVNSVVGLASDNQRGYLPRVEVAGFFLSRFLGCRLRDAPRLATKAFFIATQEFINSRVADPVLKKQYEVALLTEMNSNRSVIDPGAFAREHMAAEFRQPLIQHLIAEAAPAAPFPKDIDLIATQVRQMVIEFNGGLSLTGTPEGFGAVELRTSPQGQQEAVIRDSVKNVRGK